MRDWEADKRLCQEATPGPLEIERNGATLDEFEWEVCDLDELPISRFDRKEDARFFIAARTGWPAALDRIAELEEAYQDCCIHLAERAAHSDRMTSRVSELEAELEEFRVDRSEFSMAQNAIVGRAECAEEANRAMAALLRKYGRHLPGCEGLRRAYGESCSCGWEEARKEVADA